MSDCKNDVVIYEGRELRKEPWVMDSGASSHICFNKHLFDTYEACEIKVFKLANGVLSWSNVKGTVNIMMFDGTVMVLRDVFYLPNPTNRPNAVNLISLGTLESQGYEIILKNMCAKVCDFNGNVVMMGSRSSSPNNIYYLNSMTLVRIQEDKKVQHSNNVKCCWCPKGKTWLGLKIGKLLRMKVGAKAKPLTN